MSEDERRTKADANAPPRPRAVLALACVTVLAIGCGVVVDESSGGHAGATGYRGSGANGSVSLGSIDASTGYVTPFAELGSRPSTCLDAEGAVVRTSACNGGDAQSWTLTPSGQMRGLGDKCLDVQGSDGSDAVDGTPLRLWPCADTGARAWDWMPDRTLRTLGGKCVGARGSVLELETCDASEPQRWMLHGSTEVRASALGDTVAHCLQDAGARATFAACTGDPSQKWVLTPSGLVVSDEGRLLTHAPGTAEGSATEIVMAAPGLLVAQTWTQQGYTLRPAGDVDACLTDVAAPGDANGASVVRRCEGAADQDFVFAQPLSVALIPQVGTNWCWLATAQMVIEYMGAGPWATQCAMANAILRPSGEVPANVDCCATPTPAVCGDRIGRVETALEAYGYQGEWAAPLPLAALEQEIANGAPVAYEVRWNGGGEHYMLVIGADTAYDGSAWVIVNDPENDQFAMPYEYWANPSATTGQAWSKAWAYYDIRPREG